MSVAERGELWKLCPVPLVELRHERYERLYRMMDMERFDALVVLAGGGLGRKGNLRYVSNFGPISRYAAVVFPRQGDSVLFVPYAVHITWAESISWVESVRLSTDFPKDIAAILQDRGLSQGRVGLVGQEIVPGFENALAERFPHATFPSAATPLAKLRMVKSPLEVRLARAASSMADAAFADTASLVAQGATEAEIYAAAEGRLRRLNAEEWLLLISTTQEQVLPFPSQRSIARGDLVQYSIEPVSPGGMWIQAVRMFSRGNPMPQSYQTAKIIVDSLMAAASMIKPGAPLAQAARAMAEILTPIAPPGRAPYGHGIGMDNFELPSFGVDSKTIAEVNMLIVIHPALVAEGQNYYIGDTYLVAESGAERLSGFPLDLVVV